MSKDYTIGAVVGRFQVHELHDAHKYVIDQVVNNHKKSIIFLGVPKVVGTKKNPLDFDTRKKMVQASYPDAVIIALPDVGDDIKWTSELDRRIREVYPIGDVLLYGGRDSFIPYYKNGKGQFDCKELDQYTFVSGTEVRKVVSETVKNSSDFRAGVIYQSYNQYPRVHPCVDVAILSDDNEMVLLANKPDEKRWRFVGGFSHPNDISYEDTAVRKVKTDCNVDIDPDDLKFVGTFKVDDWRYKNEEDKIFTVFFKCKKISGNIQPSDDVSALKWWSIDELKDYVDHNGNFTGPVVEEHKPLVISLLKKLKKI